MKLCLPSGLIAEPPSRFGLESVSFVDKLGQIQVTGKDD